MKRKNKNQLAETWVASLLLFLSFKQKARAEAVTFLLLPPLTTDTRVSSESLGISSGAPLLHSLLPFPLIFFIQSGNFLEMSFCDASLPKQNRTTKLPVVVFVV